nr:MAG TPA: hypothetical protein [Caudoviricetes sp.]
MQLAIETIIVFGAFPAIMGALIVLVYILFNQE